MKKLIKRKRPIKVCELPKNGLRGKLTGIEKGLFGPIYIFEESEGIEQPLYGCSELGCIKEKHLDKEFEIIYKGQPYLEQGSTQFDLDVFILIEEV